jgi:hypothetical protein
MIRMSDAQHSTPAQRHGSSDYLDRAVDGWAGWIVFAAIIALMLGGAHIIMGLVALLRDEYYLTNSDGLVVSVDYTAWGWAHLILGLIALAAGVGLLQGRQWGRILGIGLAAISALMNIGFLSAYPIWCAIIIAFDVIVIYALTVHWGNVQSGRQ